MIVVVMGVTGSGKTTVGQVLAERLQAQFLDADDFHPEENVAKMRAGVPLDDADRAPWLARLNAELARREATGENVVLACSALKESYRVALLEGIGTAKLVYLCGDRELIAARLAGRKGHYMNPALLDSQFAALELPEDALVIDIADSPDTIVARALLALRG